LCMNLAKASANPKGALVHIRRGHYIMNNASAPACFLRLDECYMNSSISTGIMVNMEGEGWFNTTLHWPVDYGSLGSNYALCCGDPTGNYANKLGRFAQFGIYEGFLRDFQLLGPNIGGAFGTVNANLSGIGWGDRRNISQVQIQGFYAGIDVVGG